MKKAVWKVFRRPAYSKRKSRERNRTVRFTSFSEKSAQSTGRVPFFWRRQQCFVCRQSGQSQAARFQLFPKKRPFAAHRIDGKTGSPYRNHHHAFRSWSADSRKQLHQSLVAEIQYSFPRWQKLSLFDAQRPSISANGVLPGHAEKAKSIFRPISQQQRRAWQHSSIAKSLYATYLRRQCIRAPRPSLPALPNQTLHRALCRPHQRRRLSRQRAWSRDFP